MGGRGQIGGVGLSITVSHPRSSSRGAAPTATPLPYAVGVGWLQADGTEMVLDGFVHDQGLGQTYALVRRELDDQVVRYWIAPDSALALIVPWGTERADYASCDQ